MVKFERLRISRVQIGVALMTVLVAGLGWLAAQALKSPMQRIALGDVSAIHGLAPAAATGGWLARQALAFEPAEAEPGRAGVNNEASRYVSRGPGYALLLDANGPLLKLREPAPLTELGRWWRLARSLWFPQLGGAQIVALRFDGAAAMHWQALEPLSGRSNYFSGDDPSRWRTGVAQYGRLWATDVYPGIDLTFHGTAGSLEYDFRVSPGADPSRIVLRPEPADSIRLEADGTALIEVSRSSIELHKPVAYQVRDGTREPVDASFIVRGKTLAFALGAYDRSLPLVIDPVLVYASFVGGGDNTTNAYGLALDKHGNAYITGSTCAQDFPSTAGSASTRGGAAFIVDDCQDVFVTKLSADGSSLLYSTFLGGKGIDAAIRIAVDAAGAAYVTGITLSTDFPTSAHAYARRAKGGRCQVTFGNKRDCSDAFVSKLSSDGSKLIYSTYIGGSRMDLGFGIAVDAAGAAYISGWTNSPNLPVSAKALQKSYGGGSCISSIPCPDAFIAKLKPDGSALSYLTYLGGHDQEFVGDIAVDDTGNAVVVGATSSRDFPTTTGAFQTEHTPGRQDDVYVAKVNADGSKLLQSTLVGGKGSDWPMKVAVDSRGAIVVAGMTVSRDFPVTAGAYQTKYAGPAGADCPLEPELIPRCGDAFVLKLAPGGARLAFSTLLGGPGDDGALSVALDTAGHVWASGTTRAVSLTGRQFPTTPAAYLESRNANGFVAELSADGKDLLYSSGHPAVATDIAIDAHNDVVVLGIGSQSSQIGLMHTPGAYSVGVGGALITKFSAGAAPALKVSPASLAFPIQTLNSTGNPQRVAIINSGKVPAQVRVALVSPYGTPPPPGFLQTNNCPTTLPAGERCAVSVQMQPTSATQQIGGTLVVYSDARGAPFQVGLSGNGSDTRGGSFLPGRIDFPDQQAGTAGASLSSSLDTQTFQSFPKVETVKTGGPNADDFQINLSQCDPRYNGCYVSASFAPKAGATGTRRATVTVTADAYGSPYTLTLSGSVATGPTLTVLPASYDFGIVAAPGTASPIYPGQVSLLLKNGGSAPLRIASITASPADYTLPGGGTCGGLPITIAPQASCTVAVNFLPTRSGARPGVLKLSDNSTDGPKTIAFNGIGADPAGPQLKLLDSNSASGFGTTQVGTLSSDVRFYSLSNPGQKPATLALKTSAEFPLNSTYTNCGTSLSAGGYCTLAFGFSPKAAGLRQASTTIKSNAPGGVRTIALKGSGVLVPLITTSTQAIDFGRVGLHVTGAARAVQIHNDGNGVLDLGRISASGPFLVSNRCGGTLAHGASCVVNVRAAPTALGPVTGTLTLRDDGPGAVQSVMLSVEGVEGPAVQASVQSLDFGSRAVGSSSRAQSVTFTNTGNERATLDGVAVNGDFLFTSTCGAALAPGGDCTASIRFRPSLQTDPIKLVGALTIAGDFRASPTVVSLQGIGTAKASGSAQDGDESAKSSRAADFSLRLAASTHAVVAGGRASLPITVMPRGGFSMPVRFSCSGLPLGSACEFSPPTLMLSGAPAATTLVIRTSSGVAVAAASNRRGSPESPTLPGPMPAVIASAGIAAIGLRPRRRDARGAEALMMDCGGIGSSRGARRRFAALALIVLGGIAAAAAGCGGSSDDESSAATPAGVHRVTITATAGSGAAAIVHSAVVDLNVTR